MVLKVGVIGVGMIGKQDHNRITCPVPPLPNRFTRVTSVPTGYCAKSTITSIRSPGAMRSAACRTGAWCGW